MNDNAIEDPPMKGILRTPDIYFDKLPDYPYLPHYIMINGIRIHFLDEGKKDAFPILLMHGETSWSFLYRKMIPILNNAGFRIISPDLMGFGRSDKPINPKSYTYKNHIDIMLNLVKKLNLTNITLFAQDWGGLIGLRVVAEEKSRFDRIIAANTFLPYERGLKGIYSRYLLNLQVKREGKVTHEELMRKTNFVRWLAYSKTSPTFPVGEIINGATITKLSPDIIAGYDAPFPDDSYKVGARIFPSLVPTQLRQNNRVWETVFKKWNKPFLTAFSDHDPITRGLERIFQKNNPGAQGQPQIRIKDAGHFLQEDKGEELAKITIDFINQTV